MKVAGRRRLLAVALLVSTLAAVAMLTKRGGGEREMSLVVDDVLRALAVRPGETPGKRDARVQEALKSHFSDPVTVRHVDLPRAGAGQRALLIWARLLQQYDEVHFERTETFVQRDGNSGTMRLDVAMSYEDDGRNELTERVVELGFVKDGGAWKVQLVDIAAAAAQAPEARP